MEKGLYEINYEIQQLIKEKEQVKNTLINNKITQISQLILTENAKDPLSSRELENILKTFYYDLRDIIKD